MTTKQEQRVVGYTANGREIRTAHDGGYEVQPPRDNTWVHGSTPEEALANAGWTETPDVNLAACLRCEAGRNYDLGSLTIAGWVKGGKLLSVVDHAGYDCTQYFSPSGAYLGADDDGIEPVFVVAE